VLTTLDFAPANDAETFAHVPAAPAVFLLRGDPTGEPYVSKTANLRQRLKRLLGPPAENSKRLNLRDRVTHIEYHATGSDFESGFLLYQLLREHFPRTYGNRLRLRFAALIKLHLENDYPRASITTRLGRSIGRSLYYGPFPSRAAAEKFANDSLDFFKMRRCVDDLHPDPAFPGCIYSEMKMCLAPCFAGCSKQEYDDEVHRLVQFLDTDGNSLRAAIELEREKASDDLDFERAATIHKRIEKLDDALRGKPDLARRIQDLNAVILQRCAEDQTIAAFAIRGGRFSDPCYIRFAEIAGQPRSAEQIFRDYLESNAIADANAASPTTVALASAAPSASRIELGEHLWLLARWYYSNPREGEIFFREKDWPYRKILRACSRLLLPKDSAPAATAKTETPGPQPPQPGARTPDPGKSPQ